MEAVLGSPPACPVILLTPQGRLFTQQVARQLAFGEQDAPRYTPRFAGDKAPPSVDALVSPTDLARPVAADAPPDTAGALDAPAAPLGEDGCLPADAGGSPPSVDLPPRRLALLCGRYEGVDERVRQYLVTDEISIGDFVITGGELAALVVIDAVARWIPGVLGDPTGVLDDSHASGLLEYPHYTRPPEFRGWPAPEVLLSGDHARVARWRRAQALYRTWLRRPDLLENADLSPADRKLLAGFARGETP
ncbi:MAG: tRNA (guanine(37)-N(1))-methyltransferase [Chloroflexota bacterium]